MRTLDSTSKRGCLPNALLQLQAHYHPCGEVASEKCLSAATFVRQRHRAELALLEFPSCPLPTSIVMACLIPKTDSHWQPERCSE